MNPAIGVTVLAPLLGALIAMLPGPRLARWAGPLASAVTLAAVAAVATEVVAHGPIDVATGGWVPPLGVRLRADGLAVVLLAAIAVVGTVVTGLVATGESRARELTLLWCFAWAALDALVLSRDAFNLYVTLELASLAAVAMIAIGDARPALQAALRYLLFAIPGSLIYLLGVAVLYGMESTLDLAQLGAGIRTRPPASAALALMTVGLSLKAALFPLHAWLPPAYTSARPAASALLSALISKAAFLVLVKLWLDVFPPDYRRVAGPLLGILSTGSIAWCSLLALRQPRLQGALAYSSASQLGYLFLGFAIGTTGAIAGAVYLAISHAAAAAAVFLAAGAIEREAGHAEVARLHEVVGRSPVAFVALALAGTSLMGLPPSGGFIGKWLLVRASLETGRWWWAVVVLAGGLLAAAYMFRILREAFLPVSPGGPGSAGGPVRAATRPGEAAALLLAVAAMLLGVGPSLPLDLLGAGGR